PLNEARLAQVETALKSRDVAAMILEPVICNLGALVPEPAFMRGIQDLCRRYGTLLILDEVATGFGRTGRMLAAEHSGVRPDILALVTAQTRLAHVAAMNPFFVRRLEALGLGPVQGKGLALGVKTASEDQAKQIKARCLKEGLLVGPEGDVLT